MVTNTTKHNAPMPNVNHLELLSYSLLRIFHFALSGRIG